MTTLMQWMTWIPSFAFGAVVMGFVGLPLAKRRGVELGKEEQRVLDGVVLIQDTPAIAALDGPLSKQFGTRPEHERLVKRTPIGAEPAPAQVRDGVTGRADGPRTSGNAAPTVKEEAPSGAGDPAGPIPGWRVGLLYDVLETLDRVVSNPHLDRLCAFLGRHEPRWWRDYPVGAHRAEVAPLALPFVPLVPKLRRLESVS